MKIAKIHPLPLNCAITRNRADFLGRLDPGYIFGKDNYPTSKSIGRCPDVRAPVFENDGPSGMKLEKVRASFLDLRSYKNILVDYVVYHFLRYRAEKGSPSPHRLIFLKPTSFGPNGST